jgi:hypothetical protein
VARRVEVFWARHGAATSSRAEKSRRRVVISEDEDNAAFGLLREIVGYCAACIKSKLASYCKKVLDSRANNESGTPSILRRDGDKWTVIRFTGDLKYAPATHALKLRWVDPCNFADDFLVVIIERYVI